MAILSIVYTVGMFLIGIGLLHPEKTVMYNLCFAVTSGVLFTILMVLFYRFYKPGKSDRKESV